MENTEQTEELLLTEDTEKQEIAVIAQASILAITKNKAAYEELNAKYKGATIKDINDKEGAKHVAAGVSATLKARTSADKLVKQEVAKVKQVITLIQNEGDALKAIVADTEKGLKSEKEKYDQWVEEEKEEKLRQAEEAKQARISKVFELGLTFNGSYYEIGDIQITPLNIVQYSEEQFAGFVAQATVAFEAEQLRVANEESERLAKEKELADLALAQQAELDKQKAENQKLLDEQKIKDDAAQKERDELNRANGLMRLERAESRVDALKAKGFVGDLKVGTMSHPRCNTVKAEFIVDASKANWDLLIADIDSDLAKPKEVEKSVVNITSSSDNLTKTITIVNHTGVELPKVFDSVTIAEPFEEVFNGAEGETLFVINEITFNFAKPFIDTPLGKTTLRIYVEAFIDEASAGLSKDKVFYSGHIEGTELLYLLIKP